MTDYEQTKMMKRELRDAALRGITEYLDTIRGRAILGSEARVLGIGNFGLEVSNGESHFRVQVN